MGPRGVKLNIYLSQAEEEFVKGQDKNFVRKFIQAAMPQPEPEDRSEMHWLTCTPENRARMAETYKVMAEGFKKG